MWTSAPPSSSAVTSSPVAAFTSGGPPRKIVPVPLTMIVSSDIAGHVGAAGRARAHHDGDLRDALGRHARLVEEDAAEVLAVGEDLGLQRQERAARVDEVDARQPVLERDLLRAQVLLHRDRIVGAALDRRVVGDDQHLAARHAADAGDDARRPAPRRRRGPSAASGDSSRNGEVLGPPPCRARRPLAQARDQRCMRAALAGRGRTSGSTCVSRTSIRIRAVGRNRTSARPSCRPYLPAAAVGLEAAVGATPDGVPRNISGAAASKHGRPARARRGMAGQSCGSVRRWR